MAKKRLRTRMHSPLLSISLLNAALQPRVCADLIARRAIRSHSGRAFYSVISLSDNVSGVRS